MSRYAVSCEHLASFAHLDDVSLPSKPSSNRFRILIWRSLSGSLAKCSQRRAFDRA